MPKKKAYRWLRFKSRVKGLYWEFHPRGMVHCGYCGEIVGDSLEGTLVHRCDDVHPDKHPDGEKFDGRCCCNCKNHHEDFSAIDPDFERLFPKELSWWICHIPELSASSRWPEHGICEGWKDDGMVTFGWGPPNA